MIPRNERRLINAGHICQQFRHAVLTHTMMYLLMNPQNEEKTKCLVCKKTITLSSESFEIGLRKRLTIIEYKLKIPFLRLQCRYTDHDLIRDPLETNSQRVAVFCTRCLTRGTL